MTDKSVVVLTRRQRQIVQLMKEGWEIRTQAHTAQLERTGNQPRRLSWELVQRMSVAAVIAPVCYVRETDVRLYKLTGQVDEPHVVL